MTNKRFELWGILFLGGFAAFVPALAEEGFVKVSKLELQVPIQTQTGKGLTVPRCYKPLKAGIRAESQATEDVHVFAGANMSIERRPDGVFYKVSDYHIGGRWRDGGQFSVGFLPSLNEQVTAKTSLLSGISENFFTTPFPSNGALSSEDEQVYMPPKFPSCAASELSEYVFSSRLVNGRSSAHSVVFKIPIRSGNIQLLWTELAEPMKPMTGSRRSIEIAADYTWDWSFAKWEMIGVFANADPAQSVNGGPLWHFAQKISIANVDLATSFSRLSPEASLLHRASTHFFLGADYTFWDALALGPLTMGAGYVRQSFDTSENVGTQRPQGLMLGINQRVGYYSSVYFYWQHYFLKNTQPPAQPETDTFGMRWTYDIAKMLQN